jgi:hypothetical protein
MPLQQLPAAERIRASSPGVQREPRVGDDAASGELGYLVGPHRHDRETGDAAHGVYLGVWKRQRDGRFAQVVQVDTTTPGRPSFPAGFTMATPAGRFAE